ncbi:MAG: DUF1638 domain-containing protein [Deltaproteobacteria bacterium]|jgi:hypothetical protein|nr:DUF1638 domain-containing protein [Deltaproteobacteria bacterium]
MGSDLGIVACDVVRGEIEMVLGGRNFPLKVLEFALHERPAEMPAAVNRAVEEMISLEGCGRVALGYGLCSNGTVGVSCPGGSLTVPRCHDCISMLLGSPARYMKFFAENPGTMWYTDGWIRNGADPLSFYENRYAPRMGAKKALKAMGLEIANYTAFCLINNGVGDIPYLRERVRESAKLFGKEYREVEADLGYFEVFVDGPWSGEDFLVLPVGEKVDASSFYASPETFTKGGGPGTPPA